MIPRFAVECVHALWIIEVCSYKWKSKAILHRSLAENLARAGIRVTFPQTRLSELVTDL